MPDSLRLTFADWSFQLESACGAHLSLPDAFDLFSDRVNGAPIAAHYRIHPAGSTMWRIPPARERVWTTDTWRLDRAEDGTLVLSIHCLPDERPLPVAQFAADFRTGDLLCRAGRHGAPTPYALNYPCDQVAVVNALNPCGVGIVHAGGVAFDGLGLMFCGKSGAGKTTLSRLCREAGAILLNDDRQFVWAAETSVKIAPTPWHGREPEITNCAVPLRAIFHLAHAPVNRLTPLPQAEAAARLIGNTVAPFYRADAMTRTLEWADAVTSRIPSYTLEFTPTPQAVRLCREALV